MNDIEFDEFLDKAMSELNFKQEELQTRFGIGKFGNWWFDQKLQVLEFYDSKDVPRLVTSAMFIGSFSKTSNTWKWGWSNSSVLPELRKKSEPLKELGDITGFDLFTNDGTFEIDEQMAWQISAISVMHIGLIGCYRGPSADGSSYSFIGIEKIIEGMH